MDFIDRRYARYREFVLSVAYRIVGLLETECLYRLRSFINIYSWCNNSDEIRGSVDEDDLNADRFLKCETGKPYSIMKYTYSYFLSVFHISC